jgi:GMP reductase
MRSEYNYKDILLQPKHSDLNSRVEADTSVIFGGQKFDLPVYAANMKTVIDENLAVWFAKNNYFYTMHRFGICPFKFTQNMHSLGLISSISSGVNEDSHKALAEMAEKDVHPDYVTVDIAHGDCEKMAKTIEVIKKLHPDAFVIAGNVCTVKGVDNLISYGADAVKVGIGPGSACTTKLKTGFSRPQFSAVLDCAQHSTVPIIADGGIEHNGDIAKALVAGATMVMAGGLFAGHVESPGETLTLCDEHGNEYARKKVYYGSASEHNKGVKKNVEGRKILIDLKGPIADKFEEIKQDLQSSISYAGGNSLEAFLTTEWVVVH